MVKIGELLKRMVGAGELPSVVEDVKEPKKSIDVIMAAATVEKAGTNPVATRNRVAAPAGADGHQPLGKTSPVFCANNDAAVPTGAATVVSWIEDGRPMPGETPGYSGDEDPAFDMSLRFPRRGEVISASHGAFAGTVLTVACDDGVVRDVDASHVKIKTLADAQKVKWSDDLRPMPGETPFLSGDQDPAFDMSLVLERRGIILATSDTFWDGRRHIVACDDGKVRTVAADHVRELA